MIVAEMVAPFIYNNSMHCTEITVILQAAKKQLTQRMEKLNDKMDEQKEITGAIRFEVWVLTCSV